MDLSNLRSGKPDFAATYRLGAELGSDSLTTTVEAESPEGQVFHIHLLHRHLEQDPVILNSFLYEYRDYMRMVHPGLPRVVEVCQQPPAAIVESGRWRRLHEASFQSFAEILEFTRSLSGILDYAHTQGYVFRDLNPSTIAIRDDGTAVIPDGPRGRIRDVLALSTTTMISSAAEYLAPEVLFGDNCDPRSDLFSLGMVVKSLISGEPGIPAPRWFLDLLNALFGSYAKRPQSAAEVLDLLIRESSVQADPGLPCFYCLEEYSPTLPLCPACGKAPPVFNRFEHPDEGEILVLKQLSEREEIITPFLRRLAALSGDPHYTANILTGDLRMYSKDEKSRGFQLPVIVADRLDEKAVTELISGLEADKKSEVHLVRYPSPKRTKFKNGILLPDLRMSAMSDELLAQARQLMSSSHNTSSAVHSSQEGTMASGLPDSHREAVDLQLRLMGALSSEQWNSPELLATRDRIGEIDDALRRLDDVLAKQNLGDVYNRIHSLNRRIRTQTDSRETARLIDEKNDLVESFRRYRQAETEKIALRGELRAIARELLGGGSREKPDS